MQEVCKQIGSLMVVGGDVCALPFCLTSACIVCAVISACVCVCVCGVIYGNVHDGFFRSRKKYI